MGNNKVIYEGKTIHFDLIRKNVKNVNLKIRPDSTVIISANKRVPYEYIEQLVLKKAPWILKKTIHFDQERCLKNKRDYLSGETFHYLGQPYRLEVLPANNGEAVYLDKNQIFILVKDAGDFSRKEQLFNHWLKESAKTIFHDSLDKMHAEVTRYGIKRPTITVRTMKTRWGSCSFKKEKITLNTELIKNPCECIDYVVLHELAHFLHQKHDAKFYNFLAKIMPDWKERKQILAMK